ncbi:DUF6228 family protein [Nocardia sp. NPDC060259]|uniref:DUF6228 family protein n=1 Tax=Nocardia sp. NPDC060259 TaxID=3347088 RepID=UPI003662B685
MASSKVSATPSTALRGGTGSKSVRWGVDSPVTRPPVGVGTAATNPEHHDPGARRDPAGKARTADLRVTWTVRPWRHADGNWTASTTVVLEAGEQMLQLARNLNRVLGPEWV